MGGTRIQRLRLMVDGDQLCFETRSRLRSLAATHRRFAFYVGFPKRSIETRSLPALARCFPRSFSFYVAFPKAPFDLSVFSLCRWIPSSSLGLIRSNQETVDRLTVNESIHNLRDVRDCDAAIKKVIGFD